jgi:hypothetical protein
MLEEAMGKANRTPVEQPVLVPKYFLDQAKRAGLLSQQEDGKIIFGMQIWVVESHQIGRVSCNTDSKHSSKTSTQKVWA